MICPHFNSSNNTLKKENNNVRYTTQSGHDWKKKLYP